MAEQKPELRAIASRLECVERENWILKCLVALGCALLCLSLGEHLAQRVGAATVPAGPVLEAQELRIKDASGRLRVQVRATEDAVGFVLYGANGQERVAIAADSAVGVTFSGPNGKKVALVLTKDGSSLGFYDSHRVVRAFLSLTNDDPSLSLYDPSGNARTSLSLSKDGPGLSLNDSSGSRRASLGLTRSGSGLVFLGPHGEPRVSLGLSQDAALLALFDSRGQVLAQLPQGRQ